MAPEPPRPPRLFWPEPLAGYCRFLVADWRGERSCSRSVGPGLFCTQHERIVLDYFRREFPNRRRRLSTPRDAREIDLLRARLDDLVEQLATNEASVYYIRRGDGHIKIGYSNDPRERLKTLRKAHGALELLVTEPGGYHVECERHREFASLRVEGEWFRGTPSLLAHIRRLQAVQEHLTLRVAEEVSRG